MKITREEKIKIIMDRISTTSNNQVGGPGGGQNYVVINPKEISLSKLAEVIYELMTVNDPKDPDLTD